MPMKLLQVDPAESLRFCLSPQNPSPIEMLRLTNAYNGNVAYKVKTTAPKSYLVRPSCGTLRPGESNEIQIVLQSQVEANNHRFLVQAAVVADAEPLPRDAWSKFQKDQIEEQRLGVTLEEMNADQGQSDGLRVGGSGAIDGRPVSEGTADLQQKYDELVQYTLRLEKEKKKLEADKLELEKKSGSSADGFSKLTLFLAVLIAFLVSYSAKFLG